MLYKTLLKVAQVNEGENGAKTVTIPFEMFHHVIEAALRAKGIFDEGYYLAANPDIRDAVKKKSIASAADHYYHSGYFEGRMPKRFEVDEEFYLEQNPDVAKAIKTRRIKSCQLHFDTNGFREGRAPYKGFTLF